tara:strand:- start:692 stop:1105 length:414 start_codon:yes stop_codon:yes gene_type:complete
VGVSVPQVVVDTFINVALYQVVAKVSLTQVRRIVTHMHITRAVLAVLAVLAVKDRDTLVGQAVLALDQVVALLPLRERAVLAVTAVLAVPLLLRGQGDQQEALVLTVTQTERQEVEHPQRERQEEPLLLLVSQPILL